MRFFFIKPVLGSFLFLLSFSVSTGVTETFYADGTNAVIVSEPIPNRADVLSYDLPGEPQIIERRILSTRIISPPVHSETVEMKELKTTTEQPLFPLRQEQKNTMEKTEKNVTMKVPAPNDSDQTETTITCPPESFDPSPKTTNQTISQTTAQTTAQTMAQIT
ncbi:MAG: hypothetical protein LBQ50_13760, partial [Planctomycetaceae bacterium]|nr:hypothetical protein [Planctomycetaceae bacterium]